MGTKKNGKKRPRAVVPRALPRKPGSGVIPSISTQARNVTASEFAGLVSGIRGAGLEGAEVRPAQLPLEAIEPDPRQPRKHFDKEALEGLAASIKAKGVLEPIGVREHPTKSGKWLLVFGERRWRAARIAGLATIPVTYRAEGADELGLSQLVENLQREDLSPLEIANALLTAKKAGNTQQRIAAQLGKDPSWVSRHLRLLELPAPVMELYTGGRCTDVTVLLQVADAYERQPEKTVQWLEEVTGEITRTAVPSLTSFIRSSKKSAGADVVEDSAEKGHAGVENEPANNPCAGHLSAVLRFPVRVTKGARRIVIQCDDGEGVDAIERLLLSVTS